MMQSSPESHQLEMVDALNTAHPPVLVKIDLGRHLLVVHKSSLSGKACDTRYIALPLASTTSIAVASEGRAAHTSSPEEWPWTIHGFQLTYRLLDPKSLAWSAQCKNMVRKCRRLVQAQLSEKKTLLTRKLADLQPSVT